jgi:hypothetical protein
MYTINDIHKNGSKFNPKDLIFNAKEQLEYRSNPEKTDNGY